MVLPEQKTGAMYKNKWVKRWEKSVASEKTAPFRPDGSKLKAKNIMPMLREIRWAYLTSAYSRSKKKIYVFDSSGVLGKGWTVYGSRKYYANAKGEITRGFKTIDGKRTFSMITAPCIPDGCTIMVSTII